MKKSTKKPAKMQVNVYVAPAEAEIVMKMEAATGLQRVDIARAALYAACHAFQKSGRLSFPFYITDVPPSPATPLTDAERSQVDAAADAADSRNKGQGRSSKS